VHTGAAEPVLRRRADDGGRVLVLGGSAAHLRACAVHEADVSRTAKHFVHRRPVHPSSDPSFQRASGVSAASGWPVGASLQKTAFSFRRMEVAAWEGAHQGGAAGASGVPGGGVAGGIRRAAARMKRWWRPRRVWATCDMVKAATLRAAPDTASMPSKQAPSQKARPASPHVHGTKVEKATARSAGQRRHHATYITRMRRRPTAATRAAVPVWAAAEAQRWVRRAAGSWTPKAMASAAA
jgi:hypothetical protein